MPAASTDGRAIEKLRRMISLSATFQGETGGASTALNHIYYGSVPDLLDQAAHPRPLAMLALEDHLDSFIAGGDQNFLRTHGRLAWTMIRNVSSNGDTSAEYLAQVEWFSKVVQEVVALANVDDGGSPYLPAESHLSIVRLDQNAFGLVQESLATGLIQFYGMELTVFWGDSERERR